MKRTTQPTTLFKLLSRACGLTMEESAAFVAVRFGTAKDWWNGRNDAPDGVINELRALLSIINNAARNRLEAMYKEGAQETITITVHGTDEGAQAEGLPFRGVSEAIARRMVETIPPDLVTSVRILIV